MRVLFATPELHPLVKVGGLADVARALPATLRSRAIDARVVMPLYRSLAHRVGTPRHCLAPYAPGIRSRLDVFESVVPGTDLPLYLVDAPGYFDRDGSPYADADGTTHGDEAERWLAFGYAVAALACGGDDRGWRPEVLHGNDWPCGLAHALVATRSMRPATVFTVHNLAYRGLFDSDLIGRMGLPAAWWHSDALEFHGQLALIKGGLVYADRLTTVSPGYAREILHEGHGAGLDGLLRHRRTVLHGILNGIDDQHWDPARDAHLAATYSWRDPNGKRACQAALRSRFGWPQDTRPLLASVGRLVTQKGVELLLDCVPALAARGVRLLVVGSGEPRLEQSLAALASLHRDWFALHLGFDEALAHQVEAGADLFLMPSLYEPCGLNQLYSQRYGTPPLVHATGGLGDTVTETDAAGVLAGRGTGFVFHQPTPDAFIAAVDRALAVWRDPPAWAALQRNGMVRDFGWASSADRYVELYRDALAGRGEAQGLAAASR